MITSTRAPACVKRLAKKAALYAAMVAADTQENPFAFDHVTTSAPPVAPGSMGMDSGIITYADRCVRIATTAAGANKSSWQIVCPYDILQAGTNCACFLKQKSELYSHLQ